ncbi:uncharacterized protein LOC143209934 [Lasioglossum baleicum]|uniref:uncharacterized protein LOC143209934 n=1 Tax=Lasioglossum baleicum TaxID=434251 RepID=UPI003FCD8704
MRATVFLAVCLSLIAVAWGNNFIIGRHLLGEVVVRDDFIVTSGIMGKPQVALCNGAAPAQHEITFVSVVAWNPWAVNIRPVKGWLGSDSITVVAVGKPFRRFGIRCTILAVPKKTTTVTSTTTPASTTPETTTPKTSTTRCTSTPTPSTTTTTPSTTTSTPSTTTTTPSTTTTTPSTTTSTPSTTTTTPSTTTSTPSTTTSTPSTTTTTPSIETTSQSAETTDSSITVETTPSPMMRKPPSPFQPRSAPKWLHLVENVLTGKGFEI